MPRKIARNRSIANKASIITVKLNIKLNFASRLPLYFFGFCLILVRLIPPNIIPSKKVSPVKKPKSVKIKLNTLNGSNGFLTA